MAGLAGFDNRRVSQEDSRRITQKMSSLLTHQPFYVSEDPFIDKVISATRVHTNCIRTLPQPLALGNLRVWLDGEFYNQQDLNVCQNVRNQGDAAILAAMYREREAEDFSFLRAIDGIYAAVIYDIDRQMLTLIADRYGLKHLYWTCQDGVLAWASELKAFLALPNFQPMIDRDAINDFFSAGYLTENKTWFEQVTLLPVGSVLKWDLRRRKAEVTEYWSWDMIEPLDRSYDEGALVEELAQRFIKAVKRRVRSEERMGITLSGGLDSRALLAAMPRGGRDIPAVTFGSKGCEDVRIAARVAALKGVSHHVFEMQTDNWLAPRIEGVWWTDGMDNLLHLHRIRSLSAEKQLYDINLNGFLGDATIGGSYLDKINSQRNEAWYYNNRGRRFIQMGTKLEEVYLQGRLPFFDYALMDFTQSIPPRLRKDHYIYNKMLLATFPEYFQTIPWQQTGLPISASPWQVKTHAFCRKVYAKMCFMAQRLGIRLGDPYGYHDYANWIRQEPSRSFFYEHLFGSDAMFPDYLSREICEGLWQRHMRGERHQDMLCRYLTFEIWLRQVYRGQMRP
jgi:asparagine synthase (glutamine-hydrolysing)